MTGMIHLDIKNDFFPCKSLMFHLEGIERSKFKDKNRRKGDPNYKVNIKA